jgi:hypothetical protein
LYAVFISAGMWSTGVSVKRPNVPKSDESGMLGLAFQK